MNKFYEYKIAVAESYTTFQYVQHQHQQHTFGRELLDQQQLQHQQQHIKVYKNDIYWTCSIKYMRSTQYSALYMIIIMII